MGKSWWRILLSALFIAAATVAVVGSVVTRYARDKLVDTDGYLAMVGPLPQDPAVAEALAKYATKTVIETTDAEASIKNILPDKLSPLAAPLTNALEDKVHDLSKSIIVSEQFSTVWINTQKITHDGVIKIAESQPKTGEGKAGALASVDLSKLAEQVRQRLGLEPILSAGQKANAQALKVKLHESVDNLRTTLKLIKSSAYVLPYAAVAFLLVAIAVAYNRRQAVIGIGLVFLILGASALVAFKVITGNLLAEVNDPTYRAAAQAIYEAFYNNLRVRLAWVMVVGGALTLLAILAGPYVWAVGLRKWASLPSLRRMPAFGWAGRARRFINQYFWWLVGAGLAIIFGVMLFATDLTAETTVVIFCIFISYFSLLHLIAVPSPSSKKIRH